MSGIDGGRATSAPLHRPSPQAEWPGAEPDPPAQRPCQPREWAIKAEDGLSWRARVLHA